MVLVPPSRSTTTRRLTHLLLLLLHFLLFLLLHLLLLLLLLLYLLLDLGCTATTLHRARLRGLWRVRRSCLVARRTISIPQPSRAIRRSLRCLSISARRHNHECRWEGSQAISKSASRRRRRRAQNLKSSSMFGLLSAARRFPLHA